MFMCCQRREIASPVTCLIVFVATGKKCDRKLQPQNEMVFDLMVRTSWGRKQRKQNASATLKDEGAAIVLSGCFSNREIGRLFAGREFESVSFRKFKLIEQSAAEAITKCKSIRSLSIWSKITRPALSQLMQASGLKEVLISDFGGIGRLRDLDKANEVEIFRGFHTLNNTDLVELANLPKLQSLIAHGAEIGVKAVEKIATVESLRMVDFEAVNFTNAMAQALSRSKFITDVLLPATELSKAGLDFICGMPQLRYLDIWANSFGPEDLDVLAGHPALEIIELGEMGSEKDGRLTASDLIPKLDKMPLLNTVFFENIFTTDEEIKYLSNRYKFRLLQES